MFPHARTFIAPVIALVTGAAFAVVGFASASASAESTTLIANAIADTYVSKHDPNGNFGSDASMSVSQNSYQVLMRFQLSLPDGASVTSVSLRVYSNNSVSGSLEVQSSGNDWDEATVTYADQPPSQSIELGRSVESLPDVAYASLLLPVTSIASTGSFSYRLTTTTGEQGSLASRETTHPPQLVVTYAPAPTTPPATANPTPTETSTSTAPATSTPTTSATASPTPTPTVPGVPAFDHIVVVIDENQPYQSIIGNADAPYINSLASSAANLTEMYAETHPSQPNYLDFFGGDNQGVTDNTGAPYQFTTENLAHQLITAGKSFGAYAEGLPYSGYLGGDTNGYVIHHAPWVNWTNYPATVSHPFTDFPTDFTQLPTVAMVVPNRCNDMHDCSVGTGDAWLKTNLDGYAQWATTHNSLLIVTWDEDDGTSNNHIATVLSGASVLAGQYSQSTNHYGLLGLIEDVYGLARIANATGAPAITAPFAASTVLR
ncbi:alkaline phosphatase family protein [Sinomonas sp. JGH33]|uniref:Alkaline phosphatase family protein n=1 Tax=Sinomonas terricola TaxID=3110330 RepID=A0ABU5TBM3_9MICC|nr:alkaline phosphatase family protein [Sinomonas sp. JGH33]MEA5457097.1 alkaline phosphatase family protein [Sinomonas sp. JGH33]